MDKAKVLYIFVSNEGEAFDDEDRFVGHNTKVVMKEQILDYDQVGRFLKSLYEIPADYGDGVTDAKVLVVVNADTNEVLPKDIGYWGDE